MSVFAVEGELTIYQAAELREALLRALGEPGELELDLAGVTEMDAAGLQLVLLARREAGSAGCGVRVTARSAVVDEVFGLCGLPLPVQGVGA